MNQLIIIYMSMEFTFVPLIYSSEFIDNNALHSLIILLLINNIVYNLFFLDIYSDKIL